MNSFTVFDLECDGLLNTVSKVHCLSYSVWVNNVPLMKGTLTDYTQIKNFMESQQVLVGHNIVRFDFKVLKLLLGVNVCCKIVDTLALSWYLYPYERSKKGKLVSRKKHGLEQWGDLLGVKKPYIADWENQTLEDYIHRCESDVEINERLWLMMRAYLAQIYGEGNYNGIIGYLTFKMECAAEQEDEYCYIDKAACYQHLDAVTVQIGEKTEELSAVMPEKITYKKVERPKTMYKKDGELSNHGLKWVNRCKDQGLDPDETTELRVVDKISPGNPSSPLQLKEWLKSLGWEPTIVEEATNTKGEVYEVEKVSKDGKLCKNILDMIDEYPFLENLKGLTMLKHRQSVFTGFLEEIDQNNCIQAKIDGLTNTLRFQHRRPVANLPKVGKPWGKEIRGLITVPDDSYTMCGADMSALEDTTKQHYMYYYDPEYVISMRKPGFDPHVDIALVANLMTQEEEVIFKDFKYRVEELEETLSEEEEKVYHALSKVRGNAKTVNFAAIYGAGAPKISKTLKCTVAFAETLHTAYWERNKAVKQIARDVTFKVVDGQMWLLNPVSGFYYSLRYEKDKFSTLNQGTGVYCFDSWLRKVRQKGVKMMLQYHDEIGFKLLKGNESIYREYLNKSIQELNAELNLNVPLGISVQFGPNYAAIH